MPAMPSAPGPRSMSIADLPIASQGGFEDGIVGSGGHYVERAFKPEAEGGADQSGAFPVERDVLGRIERVVELEAMRVDRKDRRLAPGDQLRTGAGLAARRVDQLRILAGRAGGTADRLGPGLDLADDLDAPMPEIGRDLIGDLGALDAAALPPAGEAFVDPAGETAGAAADDRRQRRYLPVVGMLVDIHAAAPSRLPRP